MDKSLCGHVDKFANNTNSLWMAYVDTVYNLVDKLKKEVCDRILQSQTLAYLQAIQTRFDAESYPDSIFIIKSDFFEDRL